MLFMKKGGFLNELCLILGMFLVFGLVMHCSMKEEVIEQPKPIEFTEENPVSQLNMEYFQKDLRLYLSSIPGIDEKAFIEKQYDSLQYLNNIPNNEYTDYLLSALIEDHYPNMSLIEELYNTHTMAY